MRINWDALNQAARANRKDKIESMVRQAVRDEAAKVTADAFQRLEARLTARWTTEQNPATVKALWQMLGALREVCQELTGLAPDDPRPGPLRGRGGAWGDEVDHPEAHCGDSACTAIHTPFGRHR